MICGIDLGSRSVKIVFMNNNEIIDYKVIETIDFYRRYGNRQAEGLLVDFAAMGFNDVDKVVATGYGRSTIKIAAAEVIAELKAHAIGAVWQTGLENFTLLDLGGQDSKVIKVRNGKMSDFDTNDKCAASTGRYLENMANVLGISLEELSNHWESPVELNATCAIFGETELIGRIVEGYEFERLAAGVNYSIYKRIKPMLNSLKSEIIVFTGGVALGQAIKKIIEDDFKRCVIIPKYPQLNGAIGCAVYGGEKNAVGH